MHGQVRRLKVLFTLLFCVYFTEWEKWFAKFKYSCANKQNWMDGMTLCKNVFRNIIISTYMQASKDAFFGYRRNFLQLASWNYIKKYNLWMFRKIASIMALF